MGRHGEWAKRRWEKGKERAKRRPKMEKSRRGEGEMGRWEKGWGDMER